MNARATFNFTAIDREGEYIELALPAKFQVCDRCEGTGSHVNEAIDGNGITQSEMEELGEDFREDYMAGAYDVRCTVCKGARVVPQPDLSRWTFSQKRLYVKHLRSEEESRRDYASERFLRMAESGERW